MSDQHSIYFNDDEEELAEWVEEHEHVFGGRSDIYKRAMRLFRDQHGDYIETNLMEDAESDKEFT